MKTKNKIIQSKKPKKRQNKEPDSPELLLEKAKHLESVSEIIIRRRAEITTVNTKQLIDMQPITNLQDCRQPELTSERTDAIPKPEILQRFIFKGNIGYVRCSEKERLASLIDLGSKIGEFIRTKDPNLALQIIRRHPEIIFADDVTIGMYLFIAFGSEKDLGFNLSFTPSLQFDNQVLDCDGIINPIKKQILEWQFLTKYGNNKDKKKAKKFLRDAGISCFVSRGRTPIMPDLREIANAYKDILEDLQQLFKINKPKYQPDRCNILRNYIKVKQLIKKFPDLVEYYDGRNEWTISKLSEEWSQVHPPNPSSIASKMTRQIFEIGITTLKNCLHEQRV